VGGEPLKSILYQILYKIDITVFLILFGIMLWHWEWSAHYLIGMALAGVGYCLWLLARIQLGPSFAVTAQAKKLVTHGLYARIRNPIYFFGGIAILGLLIAWGRPAATVVFLAVYCLNQLLRARREAQALEAAFGEDYRRYRAQTWF
jgi:protein-S-isoprenylcysteine O-methyltransferase Ste14